LFANEFEWSFDFVPFGSTVTNASFDDRFAENATFTPDINGFYKVRLIVTKAGLMDVLADPDPGTTITIGSPPPLQSFASDIVPIFSTSPFNCTACHSGGMPAGNQNLDGSVSSIYAELTSELSITETLPRTDLVTPTNSLVLRKPTAQISHGGGLRFAIGSNEYNKILWWIQQGTPNN